MDIPSHPRIRRNVASIILVCALLTTGCASPYNQSVVFQTTADISISVKHETFDSVELQPYEMLLWQDSDLVGVITLVETDPQFQTSIDEVKSGFQENLKIAETIRKLNLPTGTFGFASSLRGFTTAFIATQSNETSWITISVRESYFEDILSSISVIRRNMQ